VFIAPYISPAAAAICDQYQVGYFDLAGNCRLAFDQVYIRRQGFPNPTIQKRDLRSLYSPKAERVLRVLLAAGKRTCGCKNSRTRRTSALAAANVKKLLADREWIEQTRSLKTMARSTSPGDYEIGFRLRSLEDAVLPLLTNGSRITGSNAVARASTTR